MRRRTPQNTIESRLKSEGTRLVNVIGQWCGRSPAYRDSIAAHLRVGREWPDYSVLIATRRFAAFGDRTRAYPLVNLRTGKTQELGTLSPYLTPLPTAWLDDIHTRIYVLLHARTPTTLSEREETSAQAQRLATELRGRFASLMRAWASTGLAHLPLPPPPSSPQ